ncbi:hypothetical protein PYW08_016097 [Mythimna loreyi]|uniref:Uncharacterized protein n=1 Tax=Mythimna loreyi TaxID=667449 RepID=A0ACC2QT54_9NEOP|nr:hypothetical protein PYW08_016097 [Mythimna loreyi]
MDDEIEDVVGEVKLTDSQKSVTVSNVYSVDFTDSGSERHNSSGMDTYVLEWDSEDSESSVLRGSVSIVSMKDRPLKPVLINSDAQCDMAKKITRASSTGISQCSIFAQEIFTQTSKTIIELAEIDGAVRRPADSNTLETQTSFISITENKTVKYRIEVSGPKPSLTKNEIMDGCEENSHEISCHRIFPNSLDDGSSKFLVSDTENEISECTSENSTTTTNTKQTSVANADSKENILIYDDQNEYENPSDFDRSPDITDIEEDSLMEPRSKVNKSEIQSDGTHTPTSVDEDVAELYSKLSESIDFRMHSPSEHERRRYGYLTPLTEESAVRKDSTGDVTAGNVTCQNEEPDKDVLFTNNAGIKVKLFPKADSCDDSEIFKLPPIQGNSCPESLNFLFTLNPNKLGTKSGNLPGVYEERKERSLDRWELGGKNLAAGESALISGRSETDRVSHTSVLLPPIHAEGCLTSNSSRTDYHLSNTNKSENPSESPCSISIKDKIKELKQSNKPRKSWTQSKYMNSISGSRSGSPGSASPDRMIDATERGCELLCVELIKRLRSHSWFEIADALDDLPRVLEKFWGVMAEHRIADLIRQVTAHVESPRTQVARAACNTLAMILKNTNYTKKPDFYEAVTILLIKTGSFSRPVRRAANVALDDIVCSVDLSHSVTALCIHGSCHKSPLVRCASARLLVVCCALGGGGRDLLRARPPTAACARRHALRSLAALLDDKSTEARKYAERLYSMLRPLSNFEAYYLTDVDVELASRQMKNLDKKRSLLTRQDLLVVIPTNILPLIQLHYISPHIILNLVKSFS